MRGARLPKSLGRLPGRLEKASRFISLVLRHDPAAADVTMDGSGWVPVADLLKGMAAKGQPLSAAELDLVVSEDAKGRYAFSADGSLIRASQGHGVPVDLGLVATIPPERLYHGTVARVLAAIRADGLKPMARQHVHLSDNPAAASRVGARRGAPVVLSIESARMHQAGAVFYRSENGVWLTDAVPPAFIGFGADAACG